MVDGKVRVSSGGQQADLEKGEMSRNAEGMPPSKHRVRDVYAYLDWMGNALVFQNTPLNEAIDEIEHRYGVHVALEDPELGSLRVTMTLNDEDEKDVMLVICEVIGAQCPLEAGEVHIRRDPSLQPHPQSQ